MPELPDVEATRENLERWIAGRTVRALRVIDRRILKGDDPREVERAFRKAKVRGVSRRAKYLILDLGARGRAVIHLGMTGRIVLRGKGEEDPRGAKVVFDAGGGKRVVFADPRLFGRLGLLRGEIEERMAALGVEPLSREFTPALLGKLLERSPTPVKLFLMDQDRIAGIGNILATEALHLARIHPARPARSLSSGEVRRLHAAILKSIRETLEAARAPEVVPLDERPENPFRIYGREGERCPRCGGPIRRMRQGGRSTYFCPRCQPAPRGRR